MDGFFGLMLIGLAPWLLFGGGIFYLGLRYVRGIERRGAAHDALTDTQRRVTELEDSVSQLVGEMAQLSEGQHFTTLLLTEKTATSARPSEFR